MHAQNPFQSWMIDSASKLLVMKAGQTQIQKQKSCGAQWWCSLANTKSMPGFIFVHSCQQ
jgi:hypothetical protein